MLNEETTKIGFEIERYQKQVPQILEIFYKAEVMSRGGYYIDDAETRDHLAKAAGWLQRVKRPKTGLLICGGTGNGKTTMGRALFKTIQKCNNISFREETAANFAKLEAQRDENRYQLVNLRQAEYLLLDDLGVEPVSVKVWGNEVSPVAELLTQRYNLQKFTIATSNLTEKELGQRYGDRVADRIREMFNVLSFKNESYRGRI